MAEREHILADFQACTGLENIDECIVILQQHDWNLTAALQTALEGTLTGAGADDNAAGPLEMPHGLSVPMGESTDRSTESLNLPGPSASVLLPHLGNVDMTSHSASSEPIGQDNRLDPPSVGEIRAGTSISNINMDKTIRFLRLNVHYQEKTVTLDLADTETIGNVKQMLEKKLRIPKNSMELTGFLTTDASDETILKELDLPKCTDLALFTPNLPDKSTKESTTNGDNSAILDRLGQTFTLTIKHLDADKTYNLNFPGSKTIQEVKGDVYSVTNIPVRQQVWTGWPTQDVSMTLAGSNIEHNHQLELKKGMPAQKKTSAEDSMEVDNSEDDFEDTPDSYCIDDDELYDAGNSRKVKPLIPDNILDHSLALESFSEEFTARYGDCHPVFYIGTLENAIKDALQCPARSRKSLAIYLHHDKSILSNVFCSAILCSETIVSYLSTNFITWAWDLTSDFNKERLVDVCTKHFGTLAANTVRSFETDQLPLMLVVTRNRSTNEVSNVIHGNISLDELMTQLITAVETHEEQRRRDIVEEDEREQRTNMLQQQDAAYHESLARDRAKAEKRKQEDQRRREQEAIEKKIATEKQQEEQTIALQKEAIARSLADQLPEEPGEACTEAITRMRIRVPNGDIISRRFYASDKLQTLLNFIASKGYHSSEHKVLTTYPRRDLTTMNADCTFAELKLCPQETLTLEER